MRVLEMIGRLMRPLRSDDSKLIENSSSVPLASKSLVVTSTEFNEGGLIPKDYSADGAGKFPTISWKGIPDECQSLLLVVEDPDAPKATPFVHGVFYNIKPGLQEINEKFVRPEGLTSELIQEGVRLGKNTIGKAAYMAPTPPPGHGPHHYHYQLLALDLELNFTEPPTLGDVKSAIENHVLAYGELIGVYER